MKKVVCIFIAIFVIASSSVMISFSCKAEAAEVTEGFDKKLNIVMTVLHLDAYFQAIYDHMKILAKEENFNLTMFNANQSVEDLQNIVDDMIQAKPDGVMLSPFDSDSAVPLVEDLRVAGIPVIAYNNIVENCTTVIVSNYDSAYLGGIAAAKYWKEHFPDVEEKAAYWGVSWIPAILERETGFLDGYHTIDPDFDWVIKGDFVAGEDVAANGLKFYEDALQAHPEINFIYGASDGVVGPGVGVLQSLGRGTSDKELAVGYDGNEEAIIAIKDPDNCWKFTIGQPPKAQAYLAWENLKKIINGEELPDVINFSGVVITADNADEWLEEQFLISPEEQAK